MKTKLQAKLKEIARNKRKDYEDFLKIWCGCSEFDENGDLHCGKWSKLETLKLPFSEERTVYLLKKYVIGVDDSENPRVAE